MTYEGTLICCAQNRSLIPNYEYQMASDSPYEHISCDVISPMVREAFVFVLTGS